MKISISCVPTKIYVTIKNVDPWTNRRTDKAKAYRRYRQKDDRYRVMRKALADIVNWVNK